MEHPRDVVTRPVSIGILHPAHLKSGEVLELGAVVVGMSRQSALDDCRAVGTR